MADTKERWDEVGDRFGEIGRRVKERYAARVTFGENEKAKVNDALRQLGDALDASFAAIGDSLRDPAIRDELERAGAAIADALAATFRDVAEAIKRR